MMCQNAYTHIAVTALAVPPLAGLATILLEMPKSAGGAVLRVADSVKEGFQHGKGEKSLTTDPCKMLTIALNVAVSIVSSKQLLDSKQFLQMQNVDT